MKGPPRELEAIWKAVEAGEHHRRVVLGRGEPGLMAVKLDRITSRARQSWP